MSLFEIAYSSRLQADLAGDGRAQGRGPTATPLLARRPDRHDAAPDDGAEPLRRGPR